MNNFPRIFPVTCHTDFVGPKSTFVVIKGAKMDGMDFIATALERGAATIVIEEQRIIPAHIQKELAQKKAVVVRVANARRALAELSADALDHPAKKLKIIAITGTKGKTTTSFLIEHMLAAAGYKTALLSTVYNKINRHILPTQLTTQHPDYLHVFFNECVKNNIDYVVMEVAAQAYTLDRVYGIEFEAFLFTNFDQEHAEFYPCLDDYFHAKSMLLKQTKENGFVIINHDNEWIKKNIPLAASLFTISKSDTAHFSFSIGSNLPNGLQIHLNYNKETYIISSPLIGEFNAYNIVFAFAVCLLLGINAPRGITALMTFNYVPGRLEKYMLPNKAICFIDYAHNPSSYQSVLSTLRTLTPHLIVVCGAGGDRDKQKRPDMGLLAATYADIVILTSDNPRSEDPVVIIQEMIHTIPAHLKPNIVIELDREQAIQKAYRCSTAHSIIALLGKGPDHYQIIGNQKFYFNEQEILAKLL